MSVAAPTCRREVLLISCPGHGTGPSLLRVSRKCSGTALKRVSEHDASLGHRLGGEIRTGIFCVYEPAPGDEPVWDLTGPSS